jgi:hypothetical protein
MEAIINSVIARVQREHKVILHHYIFEGSHPHILCTARDALNCQRFFGEIKKQLTDAIKRLTGIRHLNLWEARANVSEIPSLEDAIAKIAYIYANPSNDDLCNHIEDYPGVSTWHAFNSLPHTTSSCIAANYPWIRQPHIPILPSRSLSPRQDSAFLKKMLLPVEAEHKLSIYPNSWINSFVIKASNDDVQTINSRIVAKIRKIEEANAKRRKKDKKGIVGASALRNQPLLKKHGPKTKARKVFVQSKSRELRLSLIREMKLIDTLCRAAYRRWAKGDFKVCWPPGTFPPPLPPMASAI